MLFIHGIKRISGFCNTCLCPTDLCLCFISLDHTRCDGSASVKCSSCEQNKNVPRNQHRFPCNRDKCIWLWVAWNFGEVTRLCCRPWLPRTARQKACDCLYYLKWASMYSVSGFFSFLSWNCNSAEFTVKGVQKVRGTRARDELFKYLWSNAVCSMLSFPTELLRNFEESCRIVSNMWDLNARSYRSAFTVSHGR